MPDPNRRWHIVVVVVVVAAVSLIVVLRGRQIGAEGNGVAKPVAVDPVKATQLLHEGLALLENSQSEAAVERFTELEKLAAGEAAVSRNRAIAAMLAIAPEALDKVR